MPGFHVIAVVCFLLLHGAGATKPGVSVASSSEDHLNWAHKQPSSSSSLQDLGTARRLLDSTPGSSGSSNITWGTGALGLQDTLNWLKVWFEVMLPALERSKGAWTEVGSPCAVQALDIAQKLYSKALSLAQEKAATVTQHTVSQQQQQQQQAGAGPRSSEDLALLLFRLLEALNACHGNVCSASNTTQLSSSQRAQAAHALLHVQEAAQGAAVPSGKRYLAQLEAVPFEEEVSQAIVQEAMRKLQGIQSTPPSAATVAQNSAGMMLINRAAAMRAKQTSEQYKGAYPVTRRLVLSALHALQLATEARQSELRVLAAIATAQAGAQATGRRHVSQDISAQAGAQPTGSTGASTLGSSLLNWLKSSPGGGSQQAPAGSNSAGSAPQQQLQQQQEVSSLSSQLASITQDLHHVRLAGRAAVLSLRHTEQCSHSLRPVMEGLHVSKSGGTSMCELARLAGKKNPGYNPYSNCKLPEFQLSPRWGTQGRYPDFVPDKCRQNWAFWVVPKATCAQWIMQDESRSCASRLAVLQNRSVTWHMNEVALYHSKPGDPYSSHPCTNDVVTVMMLRDPTERVISHISHLKGLYDNTMRSICRHGLNLTEAQMPIWSLPTNLTWLAWAAPQTLDNAALRFLVGRHVHCRDLDLSRGSSLSGEDYASGLARLMALDYVLVLGQEVANLTDVVMRLGLGWPMTLVDVAFRKQNKPHQLEADLGFPVGTEALVHSLNEWDRQLTDSGRAILTMDAAYYATASAAMAAANGRLLHGGGSSGGQQRAGKYGGNRGSVNASACELLLSPDVPLVRLKRLMGDTDPASLDVLRKACEKGRKQDLRGKESVLMANEYTGARGSGSQQAGGMSRSLVQQLLMFGVRIHDMATALPRLTGHSLNL